MPSTTNLTFGYNKQKQLFISIKVILLVLSFILQYTSPGNVVLDVMLFVLKVIIIVSLIADYRQSKRLSTEILLYSDKIQLPFRIPNKGDIIINFSDVKDLSLFSTFKRTLKIRTTEKTYVLEEKKMKQDDFNTLIEKLNERVNLS